MSKPTFLFRRCRMTFLPLERATRDPRPSGNSPCPAEGPSEPQIARGRAPTVSSRSRLAGRFLSVGVLLVVVATAFGAGPATRPAGPAVPAGVQVLEDLEYGRGGGTPLLLDLYLPEKREKGDDGKDKKLPIVVWVHGGAWSAGSKRGSNGMFLLQHGYAVASVEYRFSQVARFPAQINDCKAAIRWLRANADKYGLDGAHIGAWGSSAGGHLVALLGTSGDVKALEGDGGNPGQSSRVQAVCDWFGPTDFLKMDEQAIPQATMKHGTPNSPESHLIGGTLKDHPDLVAAASPLTYVTKDDPPFLIMHGDKDPLVPLAQSEMLRDALKKAGVEVTLHVVEGAGHGFGSPELSHQVLAFFDQHLKQ